MKLPTPRRACAIASELLTFAASRTFWPRLWLSRPAPPGTPAVFYGQNRLPGLHDVAHGGMIKVMHMQRAFPHSMHPCNLLYLVSSAMPYDLSLFLAWKARKGIPLVLNQNGVAYHGWYGPGYERANRPFARALREASHIFYQSAFCKDGADRFLGAPQGSWEVLHNPVDTRLFAPRGPKPVSPLVLLLGGSQYFRYRLEAALRTLGVLVRGGCDARLLVTGQICWDKDPAASMAQTREWIERLGIAGRVEFLGAYTQHQAPDIMGRAHILLHTQYNDACPGLVLEAMACGLPIVYSRSGGVPELVGEDAGLGVDAPASYERIYPPDPEALAEAVLRVAANLPGYGAAARRRAVEHFDIEPWLTRHDRVFRELTQCPS